MQQKAVIISWQMKATPNVDNIFGNVNFAIYFF